MPRTILDDISDLPEPQRSQVIQRIELMQLAAYEQGYRSALWFYIVLRWRCGYGSKDDPRSSG